jgi:WD40 repeat protein
LAAIVKENFRDVVKIWSIGTGEVQRALMPNRSFVGSLAFSPDGKSLAASCNGAVLFWSTDTGQKLAAHETGDNEAVLSVALSPDGKSFAYAYSGISNTVRLRPLGEARYLAQMGFVLGVIVSPDGKTIATASTRAEAASRARGVLRLWSTETGEPLREIVAGEGTIFGSVAFSPDSKVLACTTRDLDTGASNVSRLEVQTGRELHTAAGTAMVLAFSPDGKILAGSGAGPGNPDNTVRLWKAVTLEPIRTLPSQQEVIHSLAFSPSGKILTSGGSDSTVKVWSIESGQELLTFTGHVPDRENTAERRPRMPVNQLAFSSGGQTVGSACGTQIKLWSAATGQELHDLVNEPPRLGTESRATRLFDGPGSRLTTMSFSPDGKTIVTTGPDRRLTFWALTNGREQSSLELPYEASLLGFSPDGRSLVTWNANGSCYILPAPFARP